MISLRAKRLDEALLRQVIDMIDIPRITLRDENPFSYFSWLLTINFFDLRASGSENFHCRGFRVKSFASRLHPSPTCLISLPAQPGEVLASHKKPFPNTAFIKRREGKSFLPFPHSVESFTSYLCYCLCCSFLRPLFGHKSKWNYSFLSLRRLLP